MKKLFTLMLLAIVSLSVFSADIIGDTKLYLKPNSNWRIDDARFAAYFFDSGGGYAWASMTYIEEHDGYPVYEAITPVGTWTNVIFCRMNPGTSTNDWDNKWNQTEDLVYDGTNNCFQVASGAWDKGGGTWSAYTPPVVIDPSISLSAPASVYVDEAITFSATASNVNDPVITYSVKVPGGSEFVSASSPYQPTTIGTYTFKAEVKAGGADDVLASDTKEVLVKEVPDPIVIKAKVPVSWENDIHLFVFNTNQDGWYKMTQDGDWYTYTFTHTESVNIIFVNGGSFPAEPGEGSSEDDWKEFKSQQTINVENVTKSTYFYVLNAEYPEDVDWGKRPVKSFTDGPSNIVIKVENSIEWDNVYLFVYGTHDDGFKKMNIVDGWYVYTFNQMHSVDFLFTNKNDFDAEGIEKTADIKNVTESTCYEVYRQEDDVKVDVTDCGKEVGTNTEFVNLNQHITVNNKTIHAEWEGAAQVSLYSVSGQLMYNKVQNNNFNYSVDRGVYILRINDESHKVIVR